MPVVGMNKLHCSASNYTIVNLFWLSYLFTILNVFIGDLFLVLLGISRSAKGYCIVSVLETMKTYSTDDGLTEEALVTKLRTCSFHHLFLHTSLRNNSSGLYNLLLYSANLLISLWKLTEMQEVLK